MHYLFEYPSKTTAYRNDQISWRTVYNLYRKSRPKSNRRGRGRRDQGKGSAGIGAVEEAEEVKIGEVDEANDMNVEME